MLFWKNCYTLKWIKRKVKCCEDFGNKLVLRLWWLFDVYGFFISISILMLFVWSNEVGVVLSYHWILMLTESSKLFFSFWEFGCHKHVWYIFLLKITSYNYKKIYLQFKEETIQWEGKYNVKKILILNETKIMSWYVQMYLNPLRQVKENNNIPMCKTSTTFINKNPLSSNCIIASSFPNWQNVEKQLTLFSKKHFHSSFQWTKKVEILKQCQKLLSERWNNVLYCTRRLIFIATSTTK